MTALRGLDGVGRMYAVVCASCGTDHRPRRRPRAASDARYLARKDGWRVTASKAKRKTHPDLCPDCRTKENHV